MFLSWQKNPSLRLVVKAAIVFFAICLALGLHRYYSFYASYDQGIFNQVFWNSIHGNLFQSSLSSALSANVVHNNEIPEVFYHRLGQHFTPALMLWMPIYALFPSPVTLTVLMVTLVTAGGLVLYVLARQYLEPPLSAAIAISFYCANAVIGPTLANFHDICQIPLFMFSLLLAMEKRWWILFWFLAICILGVREDSGIILFGVGIYLILSKRYPQIGLSICILSFGYIILLTNLIMPLFSPDISQRFMIERFGQYADGEEASTLQIIWGMVRNPGNLLLELFTPFGDTVKYLLGQWLPLALVPAIAPESWMIAGFPLLKLFLAKGESVLSITIRYAMTVVPGLFYGAILWWGRTAQKYPTVNQLVFPPDFFRLPSKLHFGKFWVICLSLSLFFTVTSNPNRTLWFLIPDSVTPWVQVSWIKQWQHVGELRSILAQIPSDVSVSTTTYIVPHLSSRREVLRLPRLQLKNDNREVIKVNYIIADIWQLQQYQIAFKSDLRMIKKIIPLIDQVTSQGEYGIISYKDGVVLLRQGAVSVPDAVQNWQSFRQEIQPLLWQN